MPGRILLTEMIEKTSAKFGVFIVLKATTLNHFSVIIVVLFFLL